MAYENLVIESELEEIKNNVNKKNTKKSTAQNIVKKDLKFIKGFDVKDIIIPNKSEDIEMPDMFKSISKDENENMMILKELFTSKDIKMKSELLNHEIRGIARMDFFASTFNIPILKEWIEDFLLLRVSLARKGRGEFIDALKSHKDEMQQGNSVFNLLRSGKL